MHTLMFRPLPWALDQIQTMQSERTQAPNITRWGERLATYWISWQPALWDCRLPRFNLKQLEPFPPQRRHRYVYFQQRCYPFTAKWLPNIYAQLLQATNETRGAVDRETQADKQTEKGNSARRTKLLTRHFAEKRKKRLPSRIPQAFLRIMQRSHKWGEDKSTSKEERTTEKTLFEAQGQKEILGDEKAPPPSSRMPSVNSANRKRRRTEGNNVFKKPKFFLRENQSPRNTKRRNKNRKTATRKRALPQTTRSREKLEALSLSINRTKNEEEEASTRRRRWCFQIALQLLRNPRRSFTKYHKISSQQKLYQNCWRNCYTLPQFLCAQPKANKRHATGMIERACAREERERAMLHNLLTALVLIPNLSRTSRNESEPLSEPIYSGDPGPQSLPNLILSHRQGIRGFGLGGRCFRSTSTEPRIIN